MSESEKDGKPDGPGAGKKSEKRKPEWTDGLKHLYDSVVEEPLPDSIKQLLDRLDDEK